MRRSEFFQMRPMPRRDAVTSFDKYELDTQFSYFSQMEPEDIALSFNRRKGASAASQARRQSSVEDKLYRN